jgi:transposase
MGLDLGDRTSSYCMVSEEGKVLSRGTVVTSIAAFQRKFGRLRPLRVVLETGTHSGWASWTLKEAGHEVIVANARQLSLISRSWKKSDQRDPEMLARLGRRDLSLLAPVEHARPERQLDLARIRARDAGVRARTLLINNARNLAKSNGYRLPACGSEAFGARMEGALPQAMVEVLKPLVSSVAVLTREIREYDRQIEQLAGERYPETALLRQVKGVGADGHGLRAADRTQGTVSQEPGRGGLPWAGAAPGPIRRSRSATKHQQGGGRLRAAIAGRLGALHPGTVRRGLRFTAQGAGAGRARRQECQETSGGGHRPAAGSLAA